MDQASFSLPIFSLLSLSSRFWLRWRVKEFRHRSFFQIIVATVPESKLTSFVVDTRCPAFIILSARCLFVGICYFHFWHTFEDIWCACIESLQKRKRANEWIVEGCLEISDIQLNRYCSINTKLWSKSSALLWWIMFQLTFPHFSSKSAHVGDLIRTKSGKVFLALSSKKDATEGGDYSLKDDEIKVTWNRKAVLFCFVLFCNEYWST